MRYCTADQWWIRAALVGLLVFWCAAQVRAQEPTFEQSREAFDSFEFDRAADLFARVAENVNTSTEVRQEAYRYLGRIHVIKKQHTMARRAIEQLLGLEPPPVELNPDIEPLPLLKLYYSVRKEQSGGYQVEKPDPGVKTLAIMDFTNGSVDEYERFDPLRKGVPSMMINYLHGATDLKVVERERIQWLLDELQLQQQGGVVDQSTAVRMGKIMGAHSVLFGGFSVLQDQMHMTARLVKVETSEVLLSEQTIGDAEELFELVEELSEATARAINVKLQDTKLRDIGETRSLDAMLSYSEGLSLLEEGREGAAFEKFEEALEYDPGYARAKRRMESLRPTLAVQEQR